MNSVDELRKKWIEALRSGKYEQGQIYLRSVDNQYCCLGVLCDIVNPEGWSGSDDFSYTYDEAFDTAPPEHVMEAVDIDHYDVAVFIHYNDTRGFSFEQIANRIESGDFKHEK